MGGVGKIKPVVEYDPNQFNIFYRTAFLYRANFYLMY